MLVIKRVCRLTAVCQFLVRALFGIAAVLLVLPVEVRGQDHKDLAASILERLPQEQLPKNAVISLRGQVGDYDLGASKQLRDFLLQHNDLAVRQNLLTVGGLHHDGMSKLLMIEGGQVVGYGMLDGRICAEFALDVDTVQRCLNENVTDIDEIRRRVGRQHTYGFGRQVRKNHGFGPTFTLRNGVVVQQVQRCDWCQFRLNRLGNNLGESFERAFREVVRPATRAKSVIPVLGPMIDDIGADAARAAGDRLDEITPREARRFLSILSEYSILFTEGLNRNSTPFRWYSNIFGSVDTFNRALLYEGTGYNPDELSKRGFIMDGQGPEAVGFTPIH